MTVSLALFPHDRDCPTLRIPAERVECVCTRAYFAELVAQVRNLTDEVEQLRNRKCPCQRVYGERKVPPGWTVVPGEDAPVLVPDLTNAPDLPIDHSHDVPPHTHAGTDAPECTTCDPWPFQRWS